MNSSLHSKYFLIEKGQVGFLSLIIIITSGAGYLYLDLKQKVETLVKVNHELNVVHKNFKNLESEFTALKQEYIKLSELHSTKVEIIKHLVNDANEKLAVQMIAPLPPISPSYMSDEYKIFLLKMLLISLGVIGVCSLGYYGVFMLNKAISASFVGKSLIGLNSLGLNLLNSLTGTTHAKEWSYTDQLSNVVKVRLSGDDKTCEVLIKACGEHKFQPLEAFLKSKDEFLTKLVSDNAELILTEGTRSAVEIVAANLNTVVESSSVATENIAATIGNTLMEKVIESSVALPPATSAVLDSITEIFGHY